ncbi:MAG: SDR family oxidoreductase, partial [Deltaproteobacteria bacterium]|nr:SDR family oxidoreductase [Deltaproteobacteria bacterium]
MRLEDQVVVVTGGGGGLGEGIALCLAKAGAHVVVSDIKQDLAENVAAKVRDSGRKALAIQTDVRRADECQSLIDTALKEMDRLDILVCSAGVSGTSEMPTQDEPMAIENLTEEAWDLTIDVNMKGVFLCNRAVIPHFKKEKKGKIVNISSVAGRKGSAMLPFYSASKAGVINFTQSVATQLAPYHINVNTVCPGIIWTPMWAEGIKRMIEFVPEFKGMNPEQAFNIMAQTSIPFQKPQTTE